MKTGIILSMGIFSVNEELTDDKDWVFLTALGGEAGAEIRNNEIAVTTKMRVQLTTAFSLYSQIFQ